MLCYLCKLDDKQQTCIKICHIKTVTLMSCQWEEGQREWGKWKTQLCSAHGVHENDYELFYGVFKCLYVICARQQDKHTNDIN